MLTDVNPSLSLLTPLSPPPHSLWQDLFLEWGRYSLEAQGPRILTFAKNVTLPHDAQCGLFSSCIAAAPSQQLRQISERQGAEFSEETGGSKLLRATANARFVSAIAGPRGVVVDDSLRKTIDRSEVLPGTGETSPSISLRKLLDAGEVGRRSGVGGCGGVGQQACICHEDFCCMAPPEVRSPNKIYVDEWETLDGRNAKVACTFGVCNVTLDEVVAPGCQSYSCRLTTCQSNDGKCSLFTPQSCSTCER